MYSFELSELWHPGSISGKEGDKIIPPARSVELKKIKKLIHKSPDIREEMTADLRTQVLRGVYKIKAEQVAEKMIQHGIYILGALEGNRCCPL